MDSPRRRECDPRESHRPRRSACRSYRHSGRKESLFYINIITYAAPRGCVLTICLTNERDTVFKIIPRLINIEHAAVCSDRWEGGEKERCIAIVTVSEERAGESASQSLSPCPPFVLIKKSLSSGPRYAPLKSVTGGLNVVSVFLFLLFFFFFS